MWTHRSSKTRRQRTLTFKEGETLESFETKSVQEKAHKDMDARWAKKNEEVHLWIQDGYGSQVYPRLDGYIGNVHDSSPYGGCLKNRFTVTEQGEPGLNYLCDGWKYFFAEIAPQMKEMAEELKHHSFIPKVLIQGAHILENIL